jgi:hypothetical protein
VQSLPTPRRVNVVGDWLVPEDGFAVAAQRALASVSNHPCRLADGSLSAPRDVLARLAQTAADGPVTPGELDYTLILRDTFWALVNQQPTVPDYDGEPAAEALALATLLAAISQDRGSYAAAADSCYDALAYMKTLPVFSDVGLGFTTEGASFTIPLDAEPPD